MIAYLKRLHIITVSGQNRNENRQDFMVGLVANVEGPFVGAALHL